MARVPHPTKTGTGMTAQGSAAQRDRLASEQKELVKSIDAKPLTGRSVLKADRNLSMVRMERHSLRVAA